MVFHPKGKDLLLYQAELLSRCKTAYTGPPFFLEKRILLHPEESKVIQIDGFPITKTKRGVAYPSLDPCTFFFSVFHSKEVLFVCFVGCQVWKFFDFLGERSRREQGNPPAAMALSVYWPSCGLDSRLLGMVRISCHCQWSVDYFQWNAFVIVIIVVARCYRASWNLFNGKCSFQNTTSTRGYTRLRTTPTLV